MMNQKNNLAENNLCNIWDRCGDGAPVVRAIGRGAVINLIVRTYGLKAGRDAERGSNPETLQYQTTKMSNKSINIKAISNTVNLVLAYESLKSKPGNMTPGIDSETLDGIDLRYFKNIQDKLKAGKFKFSPARRIQIPKPGKSETRPLSIASPREKLVQKAMQQVLEPVYENIFLDSSHGFRPNRGTRTAMADLESNFQSARYIIEADFSKAFPSIPYSKLMEILREEIKCDKTLTLIKSGLKAGFAENGVVHETSDVGTPQGSVLSPLLCNIYLHKLDMFMEELAEEYNVGKKRSKSKEYMSISNKVRYWRKKGYDLSYPDEFKKLRFQLTTTPSMAHDERFTRLSYVRYADDFVIGVEGSYNQTKEILEKVKQFVESNLDLKFNPDKTGITEWSKTPFKFLGYKVAAPNFGDSIKAIENIKINDRIIQRRKKVRTRIFMDTEKVLNKLAVKGTIKLRTSYKDHSKLIYKGKFLGNMINFDHADILRYYNAVVRGLWLYYNFVDNKNSWDYIYWLLKESCASTLALKLKVRTIGNIFSKFGSDLTCKLTNGKKEKSISFIKAKDLAEGKVNDKKIPNPTLDLDKVWNAKFTNSNLF